MSESKIMHPKEEVRMSGQIGCPLRWCGRSQAACINHAMIFTQRHERTVDRDNTVSFYNVIMQLERAASVTTARKESC
jgi:hypothetical protein